MSPAAPFTTPSPPRAAWPLSEALDVQSRHSAEFMTGKACRAGVVGTAWAKLQG
jgi:hypothetical protein